MSKKKKSKFILGALVGAAVGMLFAPKKGSKIRKDLKLKFDELLDTLNDLDVEEVKNDIEEKIADIREELNDMDKEKAVQIVKKQLVTVKKKSEELLKYAIDKGTPVVKKIAKEAAEKAIEAAEEILEKFKESDKKDTTK